MPLKMSKNGADFFQVDDSPESVNQAMAKGYKPYVDMTKDGKEVFTIEGTEDAITAALGKGYKQVDFFNQPKQISTMESYARGIGQGASLGFSDEISGGIESAFTDKTYDQSRDESRAANKQAEKQNPGSYLTGNLVGGLAVPLGAGGAAKTLIGGIASGAATGAATGALSGYGANEKPEDVIGDVVKGGTLGLVLGAGAGTLGHLAKGVTKSGRQALGDEIQAFKRGAKSADVSEIPVWKQADKVWKGFKETIKSSGELEKFRNFLNSSKSNMVSRMVEDGSIPANGERAAKSILDKMSNDDYVMYAYLNGDKDVVKWISDNAAGQGGNYTSEQVQKLMSVPTAERQALRSYNPLDDSRALVPAFDKAQKSIGKAVTKDVSELSKKAASSVDGSGIDDSIGNLIDFHQSSLNDLDSLPAIGGEKKKFVESSMEMIMDGKGPEKWNLDNGVSFPFASGETKFNRLQKAREVLDDGLESYYSRGRKNPSTAERILIDNRREIDSVLKSLDGKKEADLAYIGGKNINQSVFKGVTKNGEIDPFAIKARLGASDRAMSFKDQMERIQDFAKNATDPTAKADAENLLSLYKTTDDKVLQSAQHFLDQCGKLPECHQLERTAQYPSSRY